MTRRLLNFKVDHTSIRVFDGVDYQAKKKEKEQQLKQLMLQEMEVEQTRRKRKTMNYAELAKEEAPQLRVLLVRQPLPVAAGVGRVLRVLLRQRRQLLDARLVEELRLTPTDHRHLEGLHEREPHYVRGLVLRRLLLR